MECTAQKSKKVKTKLSNSGRLITLNKKYMTTSEDDAQKIKKRTNKEGSSSVLSELSRLQSYAREIQRKKENAPSTSGITSLDIPAKSAQPSNIDSELAGKSHHENANVDVSIGTRNESTSKSTELPTSRAKFSKIIRYVSVLLSLTYIIVLLYMRPYI